MRSRVFRKKRMENGKKFHGFFPENVGKPDGKPMKINGKPMQINGKPWKMTVFHVKYTFSMENTHFPGKIHFPWIFHGKFFPSGKFLLESEFFHGNFFPLFFPEKHPSDCVVVVEKTNK